jgi:translation elongation factor EF-Tu-like GTPase
MFQMTVADVFSIGGRVVATGQVAAGSLRAGDKVLINGRIQAKVKSIEAFRREIPAASVGDNIGLLFAQRDLAIFAGDVLTSAGEQAWR